MNNKEEVLGRINKFVELEENWDSYNGVPMTEKALAVARRFVALLDGHCFVVPVSNGGIQFEFGDLEISIDEDGEVDVYYEEILHNQNKPESEN